MKLFTATALLLVGSSVTFAASPLSPNDPGWITYFLGYSCVLDRKIASQSDDESELGIEFSHKSNDDDPPTQGTIALSAVLFRKGIPQFNGPVFTIIAGQKKWKLSDDQDQILGEQADAVRASILSEPVKVQAVESDGNTQTFVVNPKRFKVANAIFNACVAELLLDSRRSPPRDNALQPPR
jgi:hypothetical protein